VYNLVVNKSAGDDPEFGLRLAKKLERRLKRAGNNCYVHSTANWDEFTGMAGRAARERPYALIVFGGDGSIRYTASQVARVKGLLGIVPCGLSNNIFQSLYGHCDPEVALSTLRSDFQLRVDAALADGNFFLGSLITGVVQTMVDQWGSKKLPRLAMTWTKWASRAAEDTIPRTTTMKIDSYTFKAQPFILNIHLLPQLLSLKFAPAAGFDDGRLVLIYDHDGSRESISHYIRDLKKNRYQYTDGIHMIRGKRLTVGPIAGRKWLMDGDEIKFSGQELKIEVLHRVLRIFSNAPEKA
jgi:diacylglycerol kinase family enzyme